MLGQIQLPRHWKPKNNTFDVGRIWIHGSVEHGNITHRSNPVTDNVLYEPDLNNENKKLDNSG